MNAEYSGTFTADVPLTLAEMFALAAQQVVSGSWTWRGMDGGWSIRGAR